MAATTLMRVIQDCICSRLLRRQHSYLEPGARVPIQDCQSWLRIWPEKEKSIQGRGGASWEWTEGVWDGQEEGTHGAWKRNTRQSAVRR